ncbi:hypothetical protein [Cognatiluteimonas telluris]|jgi:hypothetical protein|uniref:hypothetical protein n=1 Tax=Cognatiluteimonas telluris TaxID=1104775 RepID=UPI00140C8542|nr:hypothetical protein [Lysobacter telluris]
MTPDRQLCFKGARQYLHSTTLFDDLLAVRGEAAGPIDFRFEHKTAHQVRYLEGDAPDTGGDAVQVASWRDARGQVRVVEREALIDCRTGYDEDGLARSFACDGNVMAIPAEVGEHSAIEAIVAGFKALLLRTVAGPGAKLAFVRIRLAAAPRLPLQVRYNRRIGEFYQGDLVSADGIIGQIFFGEWR